ncbi:MAG: gamma-glutamyl-gamma-aminobutyrate hydrolase family protein [Candidatus Pacebacteria bacterium]|nr:gamma-glutamyl-gamma-aminobutyrate hydrolase family protein [Candidatus Paceibacterota bacterium]
MQDRPTILLVQFRQTPAADLLECQSIEREVATFAAVKTVCGVTGNVLAELDGIDGVILGGSGDYDFDGARSPDDPVRARTEMLFRSLGPTLDYLFATDTPLLGICFGHQLMGAFRGASVYHDTQQSKLKTHTVTLHEEGRNHRLFANMPTTFDAQYGHKDVLAHVPIGARLLAHGGESCRVSALAYSDNIISTQFHPELTLSDMHDRVAHIPHYLPEGTTVDEVFFDTPHARTILHNFAKVVVAG